MIQANELRIGNIVGYKYAEKADISYHRVLAIGEFTARLSDYPGSGGWFDREYEDIIPVELSPEMLQGCGFTTPEHSRVSRMTIAYANSNSPCTLQDSASGIQICRGGIGAICAPVFSLHQLQNLYFALTGAELIINLEQVKA